MGNAWSGIGAVGTWVSVVFAALSLLLALSGRHSLKSRSGPEPSESQLLQKLVDEVKEVNRRWRRPDSDNTHLGEPVEDSALEEIIDCHLDTADNDS